MFQRSAIVLLAILAVIASAHVLPEPLQIQSRIIGGQNTVPGTHKYIASIQTKLNGHICGAAILNARWVITSASCLVSLYVGDQSTVRTGSHKHNSGGVVHQIANFVVHPQYDFNSRTNDVGLVQTATAIATNANTAPIALPLSDISTGLGDILGWGHTDLINSVRSVLLQQASVPLISNAECKTQMKLYGYDKYVKTTNVCAGGLGKGIGRGDIGGPLVVGNELIGITSFGVSYALEAPDVFTRVYSYRQWIEQNAV